MHIIRIFMHLEGGSFFMGEIGRFVEYCPRCYKTIEGYNYSFCPYCGEYIEEETISPSLPKESTLEPWCEELDPPSWIQYCPQCGEAMDDYHHDYCPMCGYTLGNLEIDSNTKIIFNDIVRTHKETGLLDYERLICLYVARKGLPYKLGKQIQEPRATDIFLRIAFLNRLMTDYLYYVISPAKLYSQKYGISIEDLFQEGALFIIELIDKLSRSDIFLPKNRKGNDKMVNIMNRFLDNRIHQHLKRVAIANSTKFGMTWHGSEIREVYYDTIYEILRDTEQYPTLDNLWERVNQTDYQGIKNKENAKKRFEEYLLSPPSETISLDAVKLISKFNTENIAVKRIAFLTAREVIKKCLTDREQKVISMRFGLGNGIPATLEEVAWHYNVTRERIRQIEGKYISKLRGWAKRELRNEPYISREEIIRKQKEELKRWGEKVNKIKK